MPRELPLRANLEHLRKQAKDLVHAARRADPDALRRLADTNVGPSRGDLLLTDAQRVIAREYGFPSWAALRRHLESAPPDEAADPMLALSTAIRARDAAAAADVLRGHPGLRGRLDEPMPGGHFGATPLLAALDLEDRATLDVLLDAGADINARSHWWAGGFGVLDSEHGLTDYLISRGATVDVHAAARLGRLDRLEQLLAADPALVQARGGDGKTPLHVAANVDVAHLLLDHGAAIDARDVDHESTPAQHLVRDGQDVVRFLVARGCAVDILMAAALGDIALVRRTLDADPAALETIVAPHFFPMQNPRAGGTIYNWTLGTYKSAYVVAREFGHEDVVRLLLDRSTDEQRFVAACDLGDTDAITRLLARRGDLVTAIPPGARTALVHAIDTRRLDAARHMLEAGWPVDVSDENGATALHWASWNGNAALVRELLRRGAPLEARDGRYDATPLGWAAHGSVNCWHQDGDHGAVVEALLDAGAVLPPLPVAFEASRSVMAVVRRRTGA